jgi:signal transduction histidine kinase
LVKLKLLASFVILFFAVDFCFAQEDKSSQETIEILWNESKPFVFKEKNNELKGIEVELIEGFKNYYQKKHKKKLKLVWVNKIAFSDILSTISTTKNLNQIGASAFSITEEREKQFVFCKPYMSDIEVMISHSNLPVLKNQIEFDNTFKSSVAYAIKHTTYESNLINLKKESSLNFSIEYLTSSENILKKVEQNRNSFGFIALPIYLMNYSQNPTLKVKRQNLFVVKHKGYSFLFPKINNWATEFDEYISREEFKPLIDSITQKYFDLKMHQFVDSLYVGNENIENKILNKEIEIQNNDIILKGKKIEEERKTNLILISLVVFLFVFTFLIYILLRNSKKNQEDLSIQKRQIEEQQQAINEQNVLLAKRNKRLLKLNDEKNNLINIVAHDIRTPLNQILGLTELLELSENTFTEEQKEMLLQIKKSTIRLNKMTNNILDIEAIESGKSNIVLEKVNLELLLKEVISNFKIQADKKQIQINFLSDDNAKIVFVDFLLTIEILENLISNALKFSPKNSIVSISIVSNSTDSIIKISDNGEGLSNWDLDLLFKKFQKLSTKPTDGESSTGLGLSIVYKYVQQLNGKVWCESEKGKGSTFFVSFPIV